jgi:hypothetical protein
MESLLINHQVALLVARYNQPLGRQILILKSNLDESILFKNVTTAFDFLSYVEDILQNAFDSYAGDQKFYQIVLLCIHLQGNHIITTCTDGGKKISLKTRSGLLIFRDRKEHQGKTIKKIFDANQLIYSHDFSK